MTALESPNHRVEIGSNEPRRENADDAGNHTDGMKRVWQCQNSDADLQIDEEDGRLDPVHQLLSHSTHTLVPHYPVWRDKRIKHLLVLDHLTTLQSLLNTFFHRGNVVDTPVLRQKSKEDQRPTRTKSERYLQSFTIQALDLPSNVLVVRCSLSKLSPDSINLFHIINLVR